MSLSNAYRTNPELEVNGVPVPMLEAPNADGTVPTFIIARMSKTNKAYQKALSNAVKPFERQMQMKMDVSAQLEAAFKKVFVGTILKGWSNIPLCDVTGNESDKGYADFSEQNALALIERLPDVYDFLQDQSNTAALYKEATREEAAKN